MDDEPRDGEQEDVEEDDDRPRRSSSSDFFPTADHDTVFRGSSSGDRHRGEPRRQTGDWRRGNTLTVARQAITRLAVKRFGPLALLVMGGVNLTGGMMLGGGSGPVVESTPAAATTCPVELAVCLDDLEECEE